MRPESRRVNFIEMYRNAGFDWIDRWRCIIIRPNADVQRDTVNRLNEGKVQSVPPRTPKGEIQTEN